jgi:hypothetical protein
VHCVGYCTSKDCVVTTIVALCEVYGKGEGKIFQEKNRPAGKLLNLTAIIYSKIKLQIKFQSNQNYSL